MSTPFSVTECRACGYVAHPARLLCPVCAAADWQPRLADRGVVTELTVRRAVAEARQLPSGQWLEPGATPLAAIDTDAGVRVVARVPEDVAIGDRVVLTAAGLTAVVRPAAGDPTPGTSR